MPGYSCDHGLCYKKFINKQKGDHYAFSIDTYEYVQQY